MKRVVCIGDSITAGQHLTDGAPWPSLLRGFEVIAMGVPGDTTRLALERFPHVQAAGVDVVVIQFGHNDCNRWQTDGGLPRVSERAFAANLREMMDRCWAFNAQPFVVTLTPSRRNERHAADTRQYNHILRCVVPEHARIDLGGEFQDESLLLADGIHLSAAVHRKYAQIVQRVLDAWSRQQ